mmetsp:Transcript_73194/g.206978  ORF Transcript_73194/g.206978 Transcript_73194/m.206978 type:complete len:232 (+) Transcript_73194:157-852(+)
MLWRYVVLTSRSFLQTSRYSWRFRSMRSSNSRRFASWHSFRRSILAWSSASIWSTTRLIWSGAGGASPTASAAGCPSRQRRSCSDRSFARCSMALSRAAERISALLCSCARVSVSFFRFMSCSSLYLSCVISRFLSASCSRTSSTLHCASMIFWPARLSSSVRARSLSSSWRFTSMSRVRILSPSALSKAWRSSSAFSRAMPSASSATIRRRQRMAFARPCGAPDGSASLS